MATQETQQLDAIIANRRSLLAAGGALAGLAALAMGSTKAEAQTTAPTDTDILNFALNLEYLEANFYTLAASGVTIDKYSTAIGIGAGTAATGGGTVTTKPAFTKVPFTMPLVQSYALETANEERNHVTVLRQALSTAAVAQPNLELYQSFITLGNAIGVANFDPFANDVYFLLGAYIFEDVGVSAYHGAATLIKDKVNVLPPAAGIHAVEAYHSGLIRTVIYNLDVANGNTAYQTLTQKISAARAGFDGTGSTATPDDVGVKTISVALQGTSNNYSATTIADVDSNYLGWARTTAQVLNIVYASAGTPGKGGFFPNGLNGTIK